MCSCAGGLGGGLRGGRGLVVTGGARLEELGGHLGLVAVSVILDVS